MYEKITKFDSVVHCKYFTLLFINILTGDKAIVMEYRGHHGIYGVLAKSNGDYTNYKLYKLHKFVHSHTHTHIISSLLVKRSMVAN